MYKRMPMEYFGDIVRIHAIKEIPEYPDRGERNQRSIYGALWYVIEKKIGNGTWYKIQPTAEMGKQGIRKAVAALRQRAYYRGYDADVLSIVATELDGICFMWRYNDDLGKIKSSGKARRLRRLKGRSKWNENYREKELSDG